MSAPAAADEVVVMGVIVAPHGIKGWVKVRAHTEDPAALLGYRAWWTRSPRQRDWVEHKLVAGRTHAGVLVAELGDVTSRESALALKGSEIGVPRSALPAAPQGEIYWADLVGLTVVNRAGVRLGVVAGLIEHGGHPLLRVTRREGAAGPERLIPCVPAIVTGIDVADRRVDVDWGEDY